LEKCANSDNVVS